MSFHITLHSFLLFRSVTQTIEATKSSEARAILAIGVTEASEAIGASFDSIEATISVDAIEITLSSVVFDAFKVTCFSKTAKAGTTVIGVTLVSSFLRVASISNRGTIAFQIQPNETKEASEASKDKTPIKTFVFPAATLQPATLEPHQGAVIRLSNLPFSVEPISSFLTNFTKQPFSSFTHQFSSIHQLALHQF